MDATEEMGGPPQRTETPPPAGKPSGGVDQPAIQHVEPPSMAANGSGEASTAGEPGTEPEEPMPDAGHKAGLHAPSAHGAQPAGRVDAAPLANPAHHADASNGRTSRPLGGRDDDVPTTVMPTTQQPHARTSRNRAHRETTSPTGNKRRRDNYSDQTRPAGPIRTTTQPRRADHRRPNAGGPTPRTRHAPVAKHTAHRTGGPPQPSEQTRKTTKTTSDYIGAGYTTG